jgi:hypothetical protein
MPPTPYGTVVNIRARSSFAEEPQPPKKHAGGFLAPVAAQTMACKAGRGPLEYPNLSGANWLPHWCAGSFIRVSASMP